MAAGLFLSLPGPGVVGLLVSPSRPGRTTPLTRPVEPHTASQGTDIIREGVPPGRSLDQKAVGCLVGQEMLMF